MKQNIRFEWDKLKQLPIQKLTEFVDTLTLEEIKEIMDEMLDNFVQYNFECYEKECDYDCEECGKLLVYPHGGEQQIKYFVKILSEKVHDIFKLTHERTDEYYIDQAKNYHLPKIPK